MKYKKYAFLMIYGYSLGPKQERICCGKWLSLTDSIYFIFSFFLSSIKTIMGLKFTNIIINSYV